MAIGESKVTNMVLRMLGPDSINEINNYINNVCSKDFMIMTSMEQVKDIFGDSVNNFLNNLTYDEIMNLRSYTGYNFKNINALLRGNWTYETNGNVNNQQEYKELSGLIADIVNKFEMPKIDFLTFRGTTLDSFSDYGISELSDLKHLKGNFMYEQGFTSTSMLENISYFNKTLEDGRFCNVEVRYIIPSDSDDGVLLLNDDLSYSANQNEFLLNSGTLTKVIDVKVNEETNTAVLTSIIIPKKIYDLGYVESKKSSKNI